MNGYGCVPIKFYFKNRWQAEFGPRTVVCQSLLRMKLIKILVRAMLPLLQQIHPLLPNQQILLWKFPHVPPCINLSFSIRCKLVISPILKKQKQKLSNMVHFWNSLHLILLLSSSSKPSLIWLLLRPSMIFISLNPIINFQGSLYFTQQQLTKTITPS